MLTYLVDSRCLKWVKSRWPFILGFALSMVLGLTTALPSTAVQVSEVPNPRSLNGSWVSDVADLLSPTSEHQLNQLISALEAANGTEIAVVTVPDTASYASPKAFTTELFNSWGIGKAGEDNGLLMMVSKGDRRVEIETGYGMEGILPDAKVGQLIRNEMIPAFKQGQYEQGILNGTIALVQSVEPNLALPQQLQVQRQETLDARTEEKREISRAKLRAVEAQHRKAQQRTLQQLQNEREWEARKAYQEQLTIEYEEQRGIRRSLYTQLFCIGSAITLWGYGFLVWWFSSRVKAIEIECFVDDSKRSHHERLLNSNTLSESSLGYLQTAALYRHGVVYFGILVSGMAIASATGVGIVMVNIRDRIAALDADIFFLGFLYCCTGLVIAVAAAIQVLIYISLFPQQQKHFRTLTRRFGLSDLVIPKENKNSLWAMLWLYFRSVSLWLGGIGIIIYTLPYNDILVAAAAWISSLYVSVQTWKILRSRQQHLQDKFVGQPYCSVCERLAESVTIAERGTIRLIEVLETVHRLSKQPGPADERELKAINLGNVSYYLVSSQKQDRDDEA